ncbi:MAG TPA: sulfatase [Candidatus Hydrogenedentes bacterium]|nr:sulfatase [Candidatus Hydrogenedentota bacterium]HPG68151.1 sulfatase [Candidatus Hydrogenedentota bacterium]
MRSVGVGAAAAGMPWTVRAAETSARPNVIIILVDDMGWADTGCYGSRYYETPNIDRLAAQGMRFTNGYAACAVCSPTRASIMTGRYPARLGVTDWIRPEPQRGNPPRPAPNPDEYESDKDKRVLCPRNAYWLELSEITLAEILKPAGYATCHVGKWHLGDAPQYPDKQGFDCNIGGCDFGQPPSYFDPYARKGLEGIPTLPPRKEGEYLTDREADEAVRFIRGHHSAPFFLYMAHYAVHAPIQGRPDLVEKYKAKPPTNQKDPAYAAMVESVDEAVGRIMAALEELKIDGNSIVIFTSDNGGLLPKTDNAPLRSGKGYPYEGGIREPVIVRWPRVVAAGTTCDTPVSSIDYFPTICEAVGIALPTDRAIDGVSLMPLLRQTDDLDRDAIFWHFPHYRGEDVVPYSIIRAGDWKLIRRYDGKPFELFNLKEDLSETNERSESLPDRVRELDGRLSEWIEATGAKVPRPNPDYAAPAK